MRRWLPLALFLSAYLAPMGEVGPAYTPLVRTALAAFAAAMGLYLFSIPPPAQALVSSGDAASGKGISPEISPRRPMLQWLHAQRHSALFGTSTGLSGFTLGEFIRKVDWFSFLGFAGSAIATVTNWWLSRRTELSRQLNELRREERQAVRDLAQALRDNELNELLRAIKKHQSESRQEAEDAAFTEPPKSPPEPPSPGPSLCAP
ncbi:hypothetical protein OJF2_03840 [Aquisphaera giovannonii]|uniref:Uncharacterized protein n=1 Tax=Aquisphaera giovannonii TaxID=406548 RepID=A0A5B9VVG0_9BACT|nr:hypothetical protein [Aquisphaera giovannonii]QEH31917.1 hypothetical protein OJF2_03840 [Aquisphaera giovannonii]